jgi:hypothetical protein
LKNDGIAGDLMKKSILLVAMGMLLLPSMLTAQTPEARIEAARTRIISLGYPASLLDERVAEGRAKGVPIERVATAVERRADALQAAGSAIRPLVAQPSAAELSAGADAVEAGIPANMLAGVISGARSSDRAVAMAVLTYLHREEGIPVDVALERVAAAMAQGPQALRDLPARSAAAAANARRGAGAPGSARSPSGANRQPGQGQRPGVVRPGNDQPPEQRSTRPGSTRQ